jgi:hypothetical protein
MPAPSGRPGIAGETRRGNAPVLEVEIPSISSKALATSQRRCESPCTLARISVGRGAPNTSCARINPRCRRREHLLAAAMRVARAQSSGPAVMSLATSRIHPARSQKCSAPCTHSMISVSSRQNVSNFSPPISTGISREFISSRWSGRGK